MAVPQGSAVFIACGSPHEWQNRRPEPPTRTSGEMCRPSPRVRAALPGPSTTIATIGRRQRMPARLRPFARPEWCEWQESSPGDARWPARSILGRVPENHGACRRRSMLYAGGAFPRRAERTREPARRDSTSSLRSSSKVEIFPKKSSRSLRNKSSLSR